MISAPADFGGIRGSSTGRWSESVGPLASSVLAGGGANRAAGSFPNESDLNGSDDSVPDEGYPTSASLADRTVLFEPWHLGDALIAASMLRLRPEVFALACQRRWHALLRLVMTDHGAPAVLLPLDLPYVNRGRVGRLPTGRVAAVARPRAVLSIRGDLRDRFVARRMFPGSAIHVSGWWSFVARRWAVADVPFRIGLRQVRNRYSAWAQLAGIAERELLESYRGRLRAPRGRQVTIHVGAQWRSRQYPFIARLREDLLSSGHAVTVLAGPHDMLPSDLAEADVTRAQDGALIAALKAADVVLTNDSGPMHLAAAIGCPTLVVSRMSNIDEWLPPGVVAVRSPHAPRGYRPDPGYQSDVVVSGWPEPDKLRRALDEAFHAG